jgi:hypothetical protein
LPEFSIPSQKIDINNNARFRYQVGYWFRLINASICGAAAAADTQFSFFDSSASKKQYLIFISFFIQGSDFIKIVNGSSLKPQINLTVKIVLELVLSLRQK